DRNRSHWSTSKTPSYTKSVSWQHYPSHGQYVRLRSRLSTLSITSL
ncbi:transposase, partial [Escherichia coli]